MDLKAHIRQIPDFPKPGILFYDISTLLADAGPGAEPWSRCPSRPCHAPDCWPASSRGVSCSRRRSPHGWGGLRHDPQARQAAGHRLSHPYDLEYGSDTLQVADGLIPAGSGSC